ncbi:hypothetical protein J4E85_009758 [Alternaria conjuncta]|uniref:uncharacterized protein n=1 Tax=Alternaria conjuncta TaxID=181017 RepID=UPI00221F4860|nr:uncharacterized protein J4E85_009758 [Alternaria conjuncta]KAI4918968.1 hypothetical protein J4E85_009758 [Alternaria conjuncta]
MADPLALPDGSTQRYNELFSALPNDDARRGYLLFLTEYKGGIDGAGVLSRVWNKTTSTAQQEYINRAASGAVSHAPDREIESEEESSRDTPQEVINGGRKQAESGAREDNVRDIQDPLHGVATPAEAENPEASNETETSHYEPSDGEIAIARVGLTEADTGRAAPPQTRKRGLDEPHDDATQAWRWCKTLMDSRTRFSGSRKMRTVRKAASQEGTLMYRLYSDYAEHGDLSELLKVYYQEENLDKQIPEQFIWMVFHALADAICTLNTGVCGETLDEDKTAEGADNGPEVGKGRQKTKKRKRGGNKARKKFTSGMVHLDVKPANIFLSTAKEPYLAYPESLLADYDVVKRILPATDALEGRKDWGTKGFQAPEIIVEAAHHHYVNAKTDIWSLGMVIWKLMHTTLGREKSDHICEESIRASFQFAEGNTFTSTDIPGHDAMYSNALHQLVIDCLQINPEKRPGYETLRKKAKAEFERSQRRLGPVLSGDKMGSDIASHLRVLRKEELEYRLGDMFVEPLSKRRKAQSHVEQDVHV